MVYGELLQAAHRYSYDHFGRLIRETCTRNYRGEGSQTETMVFLYDETGVIGMEYDLNGTGGIYYFRRNPQGDVVGIYDMSGVRVASYVYDAWGNCTIGSGTTNTAVANANPFRYRGYYYDSDTGLYFCNARYYSPKWRRFLSPDSTSYLTGETVNGLNLYCYCANDPVHYVDSNGNFPIAIEVFNTLISGAMELYNLALNASLKSLQKAPKMAMDMAKEIARKGGHIKSARAIMRSQQSAIALTRESIDGLGKVSKAMGRGLLVVDVLWSLGDNVLSGEESWASDTLVDAGIAGAIYGLSLVPYVGFFLSLAATAATIIWDDEIEVFKDWVYDGWSEFWSFSWL